MRRKGQILATILMLFACAGLAHAGQVTLQWNSVTNATGYKVYYGTSSRSYLAPQDAGDQTSYELTLDPGDYYFAVTAYNSYGESDYSVEVPATVPEPTPVAPTAVSLTSNLPSPQVSGTNVIFTAQATGGSGSYEYQFRTRNEDGTEAMVRDYSSLSTYTWVAAVDITEIIVYARNSGSTAAYEVSQTLEFSTEYGAPTSVSLTSNFSSPQQVGTYVIFTAQATGGSGSYEYQFWTMNEDGTEAMVRDYSSLASYALAVTADLSEIGVYARNTGSTEPYQTSTTIPFKATSSQATSVTLESSVPSPQPEGTTVIFAAQAEGGSGSYEYQFWKKNTTGTSEMVRDYSTQSTYSWTVTKEVEELGVFAKNTGSTALYETSATIRFSSDINPPSSLSATSDLPSPQPEGTTVIFTAQAEGGSGSYEYQFWLRKKGSVFRLKNKEEEWEMAQDYSSAPTFTWVASTDYSAVGVVARNAGSGEVFQQREVISFKTLKHKTSSKLVNNQSASLSLTSDLSSPQSEGTTICFGAQVDGYDGECEYQFWVGTLEYVEWLKTWRLRWEMVRDFSSDPTFYWVGTKGRVRIGVVAKSSDSEGTYQARDTLGFRIRN